MNNNGWWGEGEIKFYMDGDTEFPTICGTGTEDYFCGSYNFENQETQRYQEFTTPYTGLLARHAARRPLPVAGALQPVSLAHHGPDSLQQDLRVTIQALGWRSDGTYLPLQDDIASTAFWYQAEPHGAFPALPAREALEII